ncbi:MAG: 1-acyl-sn-glycerol-3-phosphate acyltransferase [Paludibacter sp.]|nr:1-acyl-sn-glycerol-3-phosphate acyltransferase [Paludibacter sp.]
MSNIWENTRSYLLLKRYIVWSFRQYYSKVVIKGQENLPDTGPVIFAPNHLNALMDALAVLTLPPFRLPKVFLARADIFKLPKAVVNFIRFAKILPAYRIRDGYDQLDRNKHTFEDAEKALLSNASIGIMPEGNQGEERNIRPLVKGIFRIAFGAQQKMPPGKSVKIVPIGFEYGDIIEYQRSLVIRIGHPIDVSEYMPLYTENQVQATNELKSTLRNALESLTVHLPTGDNYELFDRVTELVSPALQAPQKNAWTLFNARREVAERLQTISKHEPEKLTELQELYAQYEKVADELQLPQRRADRPFVPESAKAVIRLKIILQSILMIPGMIANYLPYTLIRSIPRIAGIKYSGFYSSVFYVAGIVVLPLYYLLAGGLLVGLTALSFWNLLWILPAFYLSGKFSFRLYQSVSKLSDDLRMVRITTENAHRFDSLMAIRQKIIALIV